MLKFFKHLQSLNNGIIANFASGAKNAHSDMIRISQNISKLFLSLLMAWFLVIGCALDSAAAQSKDFTIILDAGHGGKDFGAIDNGVREKDINLSVALKVGELVRRHLKNTKVIFTRDDDTFVSLQGRADIANKAKGDLFISIHTNSVDAKNKNRKNVAGASVYTQGEHKDDANLAVAKRENSVIELENGYEQKYSGFDPNKIESYIIFEMAAKQNIVQSHRFAKNVQQNLVKIAGRKDRGVHQAGFWVLWATSMPSALIELDFICNPESAQYMNSKHGVDKLAEAIFEAIKDYEANYRQKQRMMAGNRKAIKKDKDPALSSEDIEETIAFNAGEGTSNHVESNSTVLTDYAAISRTPETVSKDLSHTNLNLSRNQVKARHADDGRRRRSASAAASSDARNLEVNNIIVQKEHSAELAKIDNSPVNEPKTLSSQGPKEPVKGGKKAKREKEPKQNLKADKTKDTRKWVAQVNNSAKKAGKKETGSISPEFKAAKKSTDVSNHAGARKSLKSRN